MPRVVVAVVVFATIGIAVAADGPSSGTPAKAKMFACSPYRLHSPDKLVVRVSVPHGTDLGIRTPDNAFVFVYSCDPSLRSPQWKDVDCGSFANLPRITIDVATVEGVSVSPQAKARRLFSKAGAYTVLLGKNLETENTDQTVNRCKVQFSPSESTKP